MPNLELLVRCLLPEHVADEFRFRFTDFDVTLDSIEVYHE